MATVYVTDRAGEERPVEIELSGNPTLMEAIRNEGSFDLAAMCGGMLSCSTCHVYIGSEWIDTLDEMSEEEGELLQASPNFRPGSRLSCQVWLKPEHDKMKVVIAKED